MFWLDDELQSSVYLDGIVTVVDSKYILEYLEIQKPDNAVNEAVKQVALADRIILNKMDLVDFDQLQGIKEKISLINGSAIIQTCTRSNVSIDFVLNIHSFDKRTEDEIQKVPTTVNHFDSLVVTIAFSLQGEFNTDKIDIWIRDLLWEKVIDGSCFEEMEIFRLKMLINSKDSDNKIIFQGVRELYDQQQGSLWKDEERESKLVFIGKNLDKKLLAESFIKSCRN